MKKLVTSIRILVLLVLPFAITINSNAQNYSISGTVRSLERTTGNPIPDVRIDVDSSSYLAKTNASGYYIVKDIPTSIHNIRISAAGYIGVFRKNFALTKDTVFNVCLADTMQESPSGELVLKLLQFKTQPPWLPLYTGLFYVEEGFENSQTWKGITEGNLIPVRLVGMDAFYNYQVTHLDSLHFLNAMGACDGDGDWSDSPVGSVEYKQKRELYKLTTDVVIGNWHIRGMLVKFHSDGNYTLRGNDPIDNKYIQTAEINMRVNTERIFQKECFGRAWDRGDIFYRQSYMNSDPYLMTDLDHMLNIVFFNQWAALARKEQQSNILDMEDTPLFQVPAITTITAPIDNSVDLEKTVSISWKNIFATDKYRIQVALDDQFANITLEKLVYRKDTLITLQEGKDYYARVRTENQKGTGDWSPTIHFQTKSITTNVNDDLIAKRIKIYPNPAKDYLVISVLDNTDILDYSIRIVTMVGTTVFEANVTQPQHQINTSNWSGKGVYVLQLYDSNNILIASKKIILQ